MTEALVPTPPVCSLSALDAKANSAFPGLVVRKDLVGRVRGNAVVPGYVLEFLLAQYCATDDEATIEAGIESVRDILAQHYVRRGEAELIKSTIRDRGRYRIIDKASVVLDDKKDIHTVAFANLGLKGVPVDDGTVKRHPKLLTGGVWCMADIEYAPGEAHEDRWSIADLKPIQLGQFDADTYVATRAEFTTDEWIDLLTHTIGFAPEKLSRRAKLLQLVRLIPFVERNYNLVELGPKGTGKSHIYSEFSPHGMLISGGEVTVPKLFVNNANGRIGLVGFWDVVAFDEFAGQKRVDKSLVDIMKNYMANKTFSRGVETIGAEASMVFIGNTSRPVPAMLAHSDLFEALPESYHDSAYLDRLHHYLPGWELEISVDAAERDATERIQTALDEQARTLAEERQRAEEQAEHLRRETAATVAAAHGEAAAARTAQTRAEAGQQTAEHTSAEAQATVEQLRTELAELRQQHRTELDTLRAESRAERDQLRTEHRDQLADVRAVARTAEQRADEQRDRADRAEAIIAK